MGSSSSSPRTATLRSPQNTSIMQALTQISSIYALGLKTHSVAFSRTPFRLPRGRRWRRDTVSSDVNRNKDIRVSATEEGKLGGIVQRKRKVIEHLCLLKAIEDLSEEQENDMLDHLYTTQYQMRGIVTISLGRISDQNTEQYTHAIFMRFQTNDDLGKFYVNPFYEGVLKEHVMPYCHGVSYLDYESDVEDDILSIFRKGEEFNYGVELILLIKFSSSSIGGPAEDAMASLENLTLEFPSLIVQATKGTNTNTKNREYSHAMVIRFRSSEAFKIFINSSEYSNLWRSKFEHIIEKAVSVHFSVDPIGTELM